MWRSFENRFVHITGRPFVATLPFFFAGLLVSYSLWCLFLVPIGVLLARRFLIFGSFLFALGFLRVALIPSQPERLLPGNYRITADVISTPTLTGRMQRFIVRAGDRLLLVSANPGKLVMAGDSVQMEGEVQNIIAYSDAKSGRQAAQWLRRGISQKMDVAYSGGLEVLSPGAGLANLGSIWRADTYARLRRNLGQGEAAIVLGVIAGQQSLVEPNLVQNMQRSGTLHLLSTSGFNVFLLAAGLMFLLSHLPIPRWSQILIVIGVLLAYADAVGGRPPVLRAVLMAGVYLSAFVFKRSSDSLSAVAFAAIIYLLCDPMAVYDAGFQLSFVTVCGLILFLPGAFVIAKRWADKFHSNAAKYIARAVLFSLATTVIAQVASSPLTAFHFGTVSLISPVANLVTAPVVGVMYVGTALAQIGDLVSPTLSRGLDTVFCGIPAAWLAAANNALGSLSFAAWETSIAAWLLVVIYTGLLLSSRPTRREIEAADRVS